MVDEFEVVQHPQIRHVNLFLIDVVYRTPHLHRDFEINLVIKGSPRIVCQNQSCTVPAGDIVLLNPNQPHEIKTCDGSACILCIQVSPDLFRDIPSLENIHFDTVLPFEYIPKTQRGELRRLIVELAIYYMSSASNYEILCSGLLNVLLYCWLEKLPSHRIGREEYRAAMKRVERLNRILKYVDDNYTRKICLSDIAKKEGLSLHYLSHFVKNNLNQTFQNYVTMVRFSHACKLLRYNNRTILDICLESGFSDPRYLTKTFMRNTGTTPGKYRSQYQEARLPNTPDDSRSLQRYYSRGDAIRILKEYRGLPKDGRGDGIWELLTGHPESGQYPAITPAKASSSG
ncbi:MAG: AraC family transcriptional regulator [Treponema sp.]|nr:AraC family transcriptional regulator [Treponema sp.]